MLRVPVLIPSLTIKMMFFTLPRFFLMVSAGVKGLKSWVPIAANEPFLKKSLLRMVGVLLIISKVIQLKNSKELREIKK